MDYGWRCGVETAIAASRLDLGGWRRVARVQVKRAYPARLVRILLVGTLAVIAGYGIAYGAPPDEPAATPEEARERAQRRITAALEEVRVLKERTPKLPEKPLCDLMQRTERWLHAPGARPQRSMSVAASVSAGAKAMGWSWSHALPGSLLYMDLDFGPARQPMTGAEWLCAIDGKLGGAIRLQMYPDAKHLFIAEALGS